MFELIDIFLKSPQQRKNLFWNTVWGGRGGIKQEIIPMLLFVSAVYPLLAGIGSLISGLGKHPYAFYFFGVRKYSLSLPDNYSIIFNILLWVAYFSSAIAIFIPCHKAALKSLNHFKAKNSALLKIQFSPIETVIYSSLRLSDELNKYANAILPSDLGSGDDIGWMEGCFYKVLSGKRPSGSYSGPTVESNSFFVELRSEADVVSRLDLAGWYPEKEIRKDEITSKLFILADHVAKGYLGKNFAVGAKTYKLLAQTFVAAHLRQREAFKGNLNVTLQLFEEYSKSERPLKGIPYVVVKFGPKILLICLIGLSLILLASLIYFVPQGLVSFVKSRYNLQWDINIVNGVNQNFWMLVVSIFGFLFLKIFRKSKNTDRV